MKIEYIDIDKFVIYYSNIQDDILEYDVEDIKMFIKALVVKIKSGYNMNINGYYKLDVYVNKILILEFLKMDEYNKRIDLDIYVHLEDDILISFQDYFLIDKRKYLYQDKYYLRIEDVDYLKYIEFIEFTYGDRAKDIIDNAKLI